MHKRVAVIAAAVSVMAATSLTACSSSGSGGKNSFTYWSTWNKGEPQQKILQAAIDSFTKDTGIKVNVQFDGRQVFKKVQTANNTGNVPDMVDDASENLLGGANSGILRGVNDVYAQKIPGEGVPISSVIPAAAISAMKDKAGQYAMVPYETLSTSLWFNDETMAKIGATPPATFDDLLATCEKAVAKGIACVADDGTIPDYNAYWITALVMRYLGPNWLRNAVADKTGQAWKDPKFLQAAQDLQRLVKGKGYMLSGYQGSKLPAGQQAWAKNKALYLLMGSWAPADTKAYAASGFKYNSVAFPSVPDGHMTQDFNSVGFAITKKAKHPEQAAKFIAYFLAKSQLTKISTVADNIPSRPDIPAPAVLSSVQKQLADAKEPSRYLDGAQGAYPDFWANVFDAADDPLFFGTSTPQQFVDKLVSSSKSYWSSHS